MKEKKRSGGDEDAVMKTLRFDYAGGINKI